MAYLRMSLIMVLCCLSGQGQQQASIPKGVQRVLGCMLPLDESFARKSLHLRRQDGIYFRFLEGPIPHTGDAELKDTFVNVILYDRHETRAVIRTAILTEKDIAVDQSPFFLVKTRGEWQVREGPLGPGTWDTIAAFVESARSQPLRFLRLNDFPPEPQGCVSGRM